MPPHSQLTKTSLHQVTHDWNQTEQAFPDQLTLQQCFEHSVEKYPDHVALVYEDQSLTYRALNEKANQLAHLIRQHYQKTYGNPIEPDTLIAFCCERSLNIVIFILAILKAGAAYVPLDPSAPEERLHYMLDDTNAPLILTERTLSNRPCFDQRSLICIDDPTIHWSAHSTNNPSPINQPTDLAYIIYTSGSTGKPKGVMIEHRGVVNLAYAQHTLFQFTQPAKGLQFASINFDTSVWDIYHILLSGGELHIASALIKQHPAQLHEYLFKHNISCATIPPALLNIMPQHPLPTLEIMVISGEQAPDKVIAYWITQCQLINSYGPTETTVSPASCLMTKNSPKNCIGKPIANMQCYVLDEHRQPVDIGTEGELYVGGTGLARGYLNQPELTAERFIASPFDKNKRLYKTGDLVKWTKDGNLLYIGRNDFQVKIRGYRVELGEIETAVNTVPGIQHSVVLLKTHQQQKQLVAYFTANAPNFDPQGIQQYLTENLPEYMVPTYYMQLDQFPLTLNGKVDRAALPDPDFSTRTTQNAYVAPTSDIEKQLVEIWQQVLGVDQIGIEDNFFQLGGNSLQAAQIAMLTIEQHGHRDLHGGNILDHPTITMLANKLCTMEPQQYTYPPLLSLSTGPNTSLPLSASEQLIFSVLGPSAAQMNYQLCYLFDECLDIDRLRDALQQVLSRYDVLRSVYILDFG